MLIIISPVCISLLFTNKEPCESTKYFRRGSAPYLSLRKSVCHFISDSGIFQFGGFKLNAFVCLSAWLLLLPVSSVLQKSLGMLWAPGAESLVTEASSECQQAPHSVYSICHLWDSSERLYARNMACSELDLSLVNSKTFIHLVTR